MSARHVDLPSLGRVAREYQVWWMAAADPFLGASFDSIGEALRYARFRAAHEVWAIKKPDGRFILGSQNEMVALDEMPAIAESSPRA